MVVLKLLFDTPYLSNGLLTQHIIEFGAWKLGEVELMLGCTTTVLGKVGAIKIFLTHYL